MKNLLFITILSTFFISGCDDNEPVSNEKKIAGSYFLHSTSISDSVDISTTYDSTSMVLSNLSWTPPTDEEQFENEYNSPLKAEIFISYRYNSFIDSLHGIGVWALNDDSMKTGIDYAFFRDGNNRPDSYEWVLKTNEWSYNDGSLTLTDSDGSYELWKKRTRNTTNSDGDDNFIYGCTDEDSFNYDPNATADDGSCKGIEGTWKVTQLRQVGGVWQNVTFDRKFKFINNNFTQYDAGIVTSELYYCYSSLTNYLTVSTSISNTDCTTCYPNSSSRWSWVIGTENINEGTMAQCDGFAFYKIERQ